MPNFPTIAGFSGTLGDALGASKIGPPQIGGVDYLKIDFETGEWLLGQDGEIVTDEEILVNTPTIQHGWILWSGGRPQKSFVGFTQGLPPAMASIGDDHPSEGRSFQGALVDDGDMLAFDTNRYGGRKGVDVLLGKIKAHAAEGSKHLYPRVKLTSESYANKKRGGKLTYNPVFEIVAWCDDNGNEEPADAKKIAAKPADVTASDEATETDSGPVEPVRRQRRKAAAA